MNRMGRIVDYFSKIEIMDSLTWNADYTDFGISQIF